MTQFQAGKSYATRSIVNADSWVRITIAKRTAKTITTSEGKTLRVSLYNGVEQVKPWGSYSMCPIVGADDEGRGEEPATPPPAAPARCDQGGTRHVFLGGHSCTLCGVALLRLVS